jgi:hypothetical protein
MPTDKVSGQTAADYGALKWNPDLAHELRLCRTLLLANTTWPSTVPPALEAHAEVLWQMCGDADREINPIFLACCWLRALHVPLWSELRHVPPGTFVEALAAAAWTGAWSSAMDVITPDVQMYAHAPRVYIGVIADIRGPHRIDWDQQGDAEADAQVKSVFAIAPREGSTEACDEAVRAVRAWFASAPGLGQGLGARPGKKPQGRPSNFGNTVTLYRLWRRWEQAHARVGLRTTQGKFVRAATAEPGTAIERLAVVARAESLIARGKQSADRTTSVESKAVLPERVAWMVGYDHKELADRLRDAIKLLRPDPQIPALDVLLARQ